MSRKNGRQVSTGDILSGRANSHTGPAELFGVEFELINGSIRKRDLQRVMQLKLDVTDRQARASVASYWVRIAEHVPNRDRPHIGDLIAKVSSAAHELLLLVDRRNDARRENGQRGGRPSNRSKSATTET